MDELTRTQKAGVVIDEVNSRLSENGYTAFWQGLKKAQELGYENLEDLLTDVELIY